jgi:hypothetical protein
MIVVMTTGIMRKVKCICCGEHITARKFEADAHEIRLTENRLGYNYDSCSPKVQALGRVGSRSAVILCHSVGSNTNGMAHFELVFVAVAIDTAMAHEMTTDIVVRTHLYVFAHDLVSCPPTVCVVRLLAQRFLHLHPCICDPHHNMFHLRQLRLPVLLLTMISNGWTRMLTTVTRWSRRGVVGHDGHNQAPLRTPNTALPFPCFVAWNHHPWTSIWRTWPWSSRNLSRPHVCRSNSCVTSAPSD